MMKATAPLLLALALSGYGLAALGGRGVRGDFSFQPNPLGIKGSPYGAVLAMAMQSPIDVYWHGGVEDHSHCDHEHGVCDHDHDHDHEEGNDHDHGDHEDHDHALAEEAHDHDHDHDHAAEAPAPAGSWNARLTAYLESLQKAVAGRTNPRAVSSGHQFYTRRKAEDKLRFAYELDPTHYGNYNSYQFFLNEPSIGTRGTLTKDSAALALRTINHCLRIDSDPRPALTAASAAENLLLMMFLNPEQYPAEDMRRLEATLDAALERHDLLLAQWQADGRYAALSPMRRQELVDRRQFTLRVRQDCKDTLKRLASAEPAAQAASR